MKYVIGINNLTTKKSTIYFTYIIFKFGIKKIQFHTIKKESKQLFAKIVWCGKKDIFFNNNMELALYM